LLDAVKARYIVLDNVVMSVLIYEVQFYDSIITRMLRILMGGWQND
jgi:hypothetical protein